MFLMVYVCTLVWWTHFIISSLLCCAERISCLCLLWDNKKKSIVNLEDLWSECSMYFSMREQLPNNESPSSVPHTLVCSNCNDLKSLHTIRSIVFKVIIISSTDSEYFRTKSIMTSTAYLIILHLKNNLISNLDILNYKQWET